MAAGAMPASTSLQDASMPIFDKSHACLAAPFSGYLSCSQRVSSSNRCSRAGLRRVACRPRLFCSRALGRQI